MAQPFRRTHRAEDDYGVPAYSALAGAGFGFTPELYDTRQHESEPYGSRRHQRWSLAAPKQRGPKGYRRSDDRISEIIYENLTMNDSIDASDVSVKVTGGIVTLEGTMPDRGMKHAIEDLADRAGAQDIHNRIRVRR
jgi:hypothetical protein